MRTECGCVILCLLVLFPDEGSGVAQEHDGRLDNHSQVSWLHNLMGLSSKRTGAVGDGSTFFAIRGKKAADLNEEFWGIRGKKTFIKPNGFFQALPNSADTKELRSPQKRGLKPNSLFASLSSKRNLKPNSLFGSIAGKRSLKPNSLFGSLQGKRSLKPNSLFGSISGKRNLKPNSLFGSIGKRSMKPNSLFGTYGKRMKPNSLFLSIPSSGKRAIGVKPNGLFGIRNQRNYKPNGLFSVGKRTTDWPGWGTPSGHFGLFNYNGKRDILKPNGLFTVGKRFMIPVNLDEEGVEDEYEDEEEFAYNDLDGIDEEYPGEEGDEDSTVEINDDEIMTVKKADPDFWAARGKKDISGDFWATRGKREAKDFWAARGKKDDEMVDEEIVEAQELHNL